MSSEPISSDFLERIQNLSQKRLVLLASELERRLAAKENTNCEPIAVIGAGCRLPGGADTPEAFWDLMAQGVDAIEQVPASRWDANAFYDPRSDTPGKMISKWGGFVSSIDQFDAAFFGIAPREAAGMDPQQRMLLEVSWEALEDACVPAEALNGSATGVFVGMSTSDYASLSSGDVNGLFDAYSGSGVARSVAAGRLSYFLGLKGPNLAVDTACSSSAVAIHLACQSLRQRECRLALAGGVNAILAPHVTISLSQARMLASDGRCKTFSERADGFVRSEGCGMVVLKRLSDAQVDGDRILSVIRGSAMNHDGRSSGLTAPNGPSQEAVIRMALHQAGVEPGEVDYVEAHGTGTVLGDAIELGALGSVFSLDRSADAELILGSVKTNIGHLEAAAGITSVLKVLMALQHQSIPPHLHVEAQSENEVLRRFPMQVPSSAISWPAAKRPRIAGISSFGFSGTNVHLLLQEAPMVLPPAREADSMELLTLSAKSEKALLALCLRHASHLQQHPELRLVDVAFSLNAGRSHFQHRIALLVTSVGEAANQLQLIAEQGVAGHPAYRFVSGYEEPSLGFLFTGQGSQYPGMGRVLYKQNSTFRAAVDRCDKILSGKLKVSLSQVISVGDGISEDLIHETAWTQPVLFTFEYALAMLWDAWGVRPSIALGHSLGEYVAACVAEVFPLETALTLAFERGRLMGGLPGGGAMLAVRASEEKIAVMLEDFPELSIAALNGPRSVVVSGEGEPIERLRILLGQQNIAAQPLKVSHAFHSALMEPILDSFEKKAAEFTFAEPKIRLISNVSGNAHTPASPIDAAYWRRHIRETVRFAEGFASLMELQPDALLEIGPEPVLLGMAKAAHPHSSIPCLSSLRRGIEPYLTMWEALRQLYLLGIAINFNEVYRDRPVRKLALPTYTFQRQRYWLATNAPLMVASPQESFDPLLYAVDWTQVEGEAIASTAPEALLGSAIETIERTREDVSQHRILSSYAEFQPRLDRLCTTYILKALLDLGVDLQLGGRLSPADLEANYGVGIEHRRLLERLFAILEEDEIIQRVQEVWMILKVPVCDPQRERQDLLEEYPQFAAELNFLAQSTYLAHVLQRKMSPLEALFPNGSAELAERVYRESPAARMFNGAVAEIVRSAVDAYAADHVVKIVEVGAGTGSTTSEILPLLSKHQVDYLFTDVSAAFENAARRKFAAYPYMRYGTLNIEDKDRISEELESADILIAANVLHATADLKDSLTRLRGMLRVGGSLVILEATAPQRFGDLTVGMTDGWWRFKDASLRESYPLIGRQAWLSLLAECGFDCAALEGGVLGLLTQQQTILVARKPASPRSHAAPVVLLLSEASEASPLSAAMAEGMTFELPEDARHSVEHRSGYLRKQLREANPLFTSIVLELAGDAEGMAVVDHVLQNASAMLDVIQAVVAEEAKPTVWFVSRNAAPLADGDKMSLAASAADALAKTARLEHPELSIRWVDLPRVPAKSDLQLLTTLIRTSSKEHSIAIRGGRLIAPRLAPLHTLKPYDKSGIMIRPGAAYMVTGAFGGLGLRTVQWMCEHGATCVYMLGRHTPSRNVSDEIKQLRAGGVKIHELIVDIAQQVEMEAVFQSIAKADVPLCGIVHAAGTLDDGTLLQQTRERFASVFETKVHGSWILHELSKGLVLDFFVMYGSAASILGAPGQGNHAAANAFMDALSFRRQQDGLSSTTIAWGPWSEIGAATQVKDASRFMWLGMTSFSPAKGIALLEQAIRSKQSTVAALPVDWDVYLGAGRPQRNWPSLERLRKFVADSNVAPMHAESLDTLFKDVPIEDHLNVIKDYVKARVVEVLRLEPNVVLLEDQPLAELGLDSLMALDLKNGLQVAVGENLPTNFFFEYPTLKLVATFLSAKLVKSRPGSFSRQDSREYEEIAL